MTVLSEKDAVFAELLAHLQTPLRITASVRRKRKKTTGSASISTEDGGLVETVLDRLAVVAGGSLRPGTLGTLTGCWDY